MTANYKSLNAFQKELKEQGIKLSTSKKDQEDLENRRLVDDKRF